MKLECWPLGDRFRMCTSNAGIGDIFRRRNGRVAISHIQRDDRDVGEIREDVEQGRCEMKSGRGNRPNQRSNVRCAANSFTESQTMVSALDVDMGPKESRAERMELATDHREAV